MKSISWQIVALAGLACLMACVSLGICVWLVQTGFSPPVLLAAPMSTLLLGGAGCAVAYMRGLMKMPPPPPGLEYRLVRSIAPPPDDPMYRGEDWTASIAVDIPSESVTSPEAPGPKTRTP